MHGVVGKHDAARASLKHASVDKRRAVAVDGLGVTAGAVVDVGSRCNGKRYGVVDPMRRSESSPQGRCQTLHARQGRALKIRAVRSGTGEVRSQRPYRLIRHNDRHVAWEKLALRMSPKLK